MPSWLSTAVHQFFLPTVLLLLVVFVVECLLYFLKAPFYFRMGPTLAREQWQTCVPVSDAWVALRAALPHSRLSTRDGGDVLCFRRAWWAWSAYPRATLHVVDEARAAAIVYEVKPFLCMAPFAALFFIPLMAGIAPIASLLVMASIVLVYLLLWRWELRKLDRLKCIRTHLRCIGVLVCSFCGYDLFGRQEQQPCPECGRLRSLPPEGSERPGVRMD